MSCRMSAREGGKVELLLGRDEDEDEDRSRERTSLERGQLHGVNAV